MFWSCDPSRIVGRLHLHYASDKAVIKELFVVPKARRRGYGSILEDIAVDRAREYDLPRIELWLHEADARERMRPGAEAFATQRGYAWCASVQKRPNIRAIATKELS